MAEPFLHERCPAVRETLPHLRLGAGPTPVRRLDHLAPAGAELWMKDDGTYGDGGWGGNKIRKLEWLLPDVKRRGKSTILTVGGLGTNWGLATALYAREQGLDVALALVDQPVDDHVRAQQERLKASGATLHFTHTPARTTARIPWLLTRHSRRGRLPYVLPAGGSSPIGALGYVETALEIAHQVGRGDLPEPSHVVCAVGSGGTVAGLALGLRLAGLATRAVGIVVNDTLRLDRRSLSRLARRSGQVLQSRGADLSIEPLVESDLDVYTDWLGPGYGHALGGVEDLTRRAEEAEGVRLDPVYTGKAMAGVLALLGRGELGPGPVLYLHSDGPRPRA
jgi:D-cysteine desulfhydrase